MNNRIIDALFEYFENCPLMTDGRLNIDYLDTSAAGVEYSIAISPTDNVTTQFAYGGARCRLPFVISTARIYGQDVGQNLANAGYGEALSEWLREQELARNLPNLPAGYQPRSIRAIDYGYLYQPDIDTGNYQIQCELEYYR